jgi:protein-disulfide isomerase
MIAKHQGRVRLAYRDFPLRALHPGAQAEAEAARCAADQRRFWEYHDLLFTHPDKSSREDLIANAHQLQLDENRFSRCLDTHQYSSQVDQDIQDGLKAGVRGTPAFFVNGVLLEGVASSDAFEKIIDQPPLYVNYTCASNH